MDQHRRAAVTATYGRALATLRRARTIVRRVIRQNERLAEQPGHEASARQRIEEGHAELAVFAEEEARLKQRMEEPE